MNWNDYVIRRRINVDEWMRSHNVESREAFLDLIVKLKVSPPPQDQLDSMFGRVVSQVPSTETKDGTSQLPAERFDQAPARSVAVQEGQPGPRPDGKHSSKVRPKRN